MTTTTLTWQRIASGDYQAQLADGTTLDCYRVPDLNPPAWNVYRRVDDLDDLLVDSAATLRDAKALAADALGGRS